MIFPIAVWESLPNEDANKVKGHQNNDEICPVPSHKQLHNSMPLFDLLSLFLFIFTKIILSLLCLLLSLSRSLISDVFNTDFLNLIGLRVGNSQLEIEILFFLCLNDQLQGLNRILIIKTFLKPFLFTSHNVYSQFLRSSNEKLDSWLFRWQKNGFEHSWYPECRMDGLLVSVKNWAPHFVIGAHDHNLKVLGHLNR